MLLNSFFLSFSTLSLSLFFTFFTHPQTHSNKPLLFVLVFLSQSLCFFFFSLFRRTIVPPHHWVPVPLYRNLIFFLSFCALFVDEDSYYCCCWRVRLVLEGISLMTGRVLNLRFVFIVVLVVVCAYLFARLLLSSMKFGCFFLLIFPRPNSIVVDTHARVQTRTSLRLCRFRRVM